jgi:hypothetical protein
LDLLASAASTEIDSSATCLPKCLPSATCLPSVTCPANSRQKAPTQPIKQRCCFIYRQVRGPYKVGDRCKEKSSGEYCPVHRYYAEQRGK